MQTDSATAYTLKIRLGEAEFNGTGTEESIREDYKSFLKAINGLRPASQTKEKGSAVDDDSDDPEKDIEGLWNRAYRRKDDKISLGVLPSSKTATSDSVLLLIYGYQTWLGKDTIQSTELMDSAKQSGLRIDRIDRNLSPAHRQLIIKGGAGKGSRYSLNNRGLSVAQGLLEQLFE